MLLPSLNEESTFLQAFHGKNTRVPVWFMRQAGRYLPEYQVLRQQHTLDKLFKTPELAAEITCQPISILNVDAAILFADILTLPIAMGFDIHFDDRKGPVVLPQTTLKNIHDIEELPDLSKTIQLTLERLPQSIPLIGFAGSPFTVLTYLIEGGSSINYTKTLAFANRHTDQFHAFMSRLTDNTIRYLNIQKQAGIHAFQLFDSWGGILRAADYEQWVYPYVVKIFEAIELPSIYYLKNCSHLLPLMEKVPADFLSVCHTVTIGEHPVLNQTTKGLQGNLYNALLYSDERTIHKEVQDLLHRANTHDKYIFNLSHGVFPDVDVNILKSIVEQVHTFPWKN